jgi:hypothetical protein
MEKNFYVKMFAEKRDYAMVESGRKVGAEELHPLYSQMVHLMRLLTMKLTWKAYGIQGKQLQEGPKQQTRVLS